MLMLSTRAAPVVLSPRSLNCSAKRRENTDSREALNICGKIDKIGYLEVRIVIVTNLHWIRRIRIPPPKPPNRHQELFAGTWFSAKRSHLIIHLLRSSVLLIFSIHFHSMIIVTSV